MAGVSAIAGHPLLWLVLALGLWTSAWCGSRSRLAALPVAVVSLATTLIAIGLVAGALPWLSLSSPTAARWALVAALLPPLVNTALRGPLPGATLRPGEWVAALPAAVLVLLAAAMKLLPALRQTDWLLLGNDSIEHVLLVGRVQQDGGLSYAGQAYPRGMHQIIALLVTAGGGVPRSPQSLLAALETTAALTWLVYAVLVLASSLAAVELARRAGASSAAAGWAGAVGGAALLTGSFFTFALGFGFVTTVGLAALLAVALAELARGQDASPPALLLCVACAAHVWQLGWPVVCLSVAVLAVQPSRRLHRDPWFWIGSVGAVAFALPALRAVAEQVPTSTVAAPGAVASLPSLWLFAGVLAACWWAWWERAQPLRVGVGALALGAAAFALVVGLRAGDPLGYYPRKLLWHAAALGVPLVCSVGAVAADRHLRRLRGVGVELRQALPLLLLMVAACAVPPAQAATGGWTVSDGVLAAVRSDVVRPPAAGSSSSTQLTVLDRLRAYYIPAS